MTNYYSTKDADGNPIHIEAQGLGSVGEPFVTAVQPYQKWFRNVELLAPVSAVDFWNNQQGGANVTVSVSEMLADANLKDIDMIIYTIRGGGYAESGQNTPDAPVRAVLFSGQAGTAGTYFNNTDIFTQDTPYDAFVIHGEEIQATAGVHPNHNYCSALKPTFILPHDFRIAVTSLPTSGWFSVVADIRVNGKGHPTFS